MKIIAILDNLSGTGGGFDQALNAIVQMQRLASNRFDFEVFTTQENNVEFLNRLDIAFIKVKVSIFDRFLMKFSHNSFWQFLQVRLNLIGSLEKKLIQHGCDVVYFVTPSNLSIVLQKLNYITTLWDLCHRENPEFPEVRTFNTFFTREKSYQHNLGPALLTLTESDRLADMASQYYGIERNRFLGMPLAPSPFIQSTQENKIEEILLKYSLNPNYFYYPAQFWAHKNHIRILQALVILRESHSWTPNVVFSGKDYGNLNHVIQFIKTHNLESQLNILGFVPSEDMTRLYQNAVAVVMPTYFGPTNIPPLEAWSMGVPLIYSAHLAEQAGNAALLVDPDSAIELADAMMQCAKLEVRKQLVASGYRRLEEIADQRIAAEEELCMLLGKYAARRQCWE
ncbi:glycosyltransferase [Candidatus Methylopumilus planktonicus]|uniref:glycosyltransferase n=1 Tax=Candidatus Methylopumilus planktonicus TaxID=1581557 RepID=UPI003BEF0C1F